MALFALFLFLLSAHCVRYIAKDAAAVRHLSAIGLQRDSPGVFEGRVESWRIHGHNIEIEEEKKRNSDDDYRGYHTLDDMATLMEQLARDSAGELRTIGRSVHNRPILALRLGEQRPSRPVVGLYAGIHGDEVVGPELLLEFAKHMVHSEPTN